MLKLEDMAARHPEAFPFLLIDKVLAADEGERAVGLRNVTSNDPLLAKDGRRPYSLRRGLLIEAFAQLSAMALATEDDGRRLRSVEVLRIAEMTFKRSPVPGDQVVLSVEIGRAGDAITATCRAEIGGEEVAMGVIDLELMPASQG